MTIATNSKPLPRLLDVALLYALFAIVATATNIAFQELCMQMYSGAFDVLFSIGLGTCAGLVCKFLLDKRYIFRHETVNVSAKTKLFVLYTITGVGTTLIFWGMELLFHVLFETRAMRYLGGVIGLAIGYVIKFQLDARYVFRG